MEVTPAELAGSKALSCWTIVLGCGLVAFSLPEVSSCQPLLALLPVRSALLPIITPIFYFLFSSLQGLEDWKKLSYSREPLRFTLTH